MLNLQKSTTMALYESVLFLIIDSDSDTTQNLINPLQCTLQPKKALTLLIYLVTAQTGGARAHTVLLIY